MGWRKKQPKPPDFSKFDESRLDSVAPDFTVLPPGGPLMKVPFEMVQGPPKIEYEELWKRLGARAWDVLTRKRMSDIWPVEPPMEFERYMELLDRTRETNPEYEAEVFIGLQHPIESLLKPERTDFSPLFVPRFVFQRHAYILGGSGSGKTTSALATILLQLATPYAWTQPKRVDKAPILIIDMKQNGDRFLRAYAEKIAEDEGRRFRFFSNDPDYESHVFDPLHALRTIQYPLKLLETLLKAFSLIYPEGYGSDFFTSEQRVQLMKILYEHRPRTLDELIQFISSATSGKSGNKDARGLYSALAALQYAVNLNTDGSPVDPDRLIDFERFFEDGEVLYVHLDARANALLSRDIGKLLLFSLLETASQREKRGALKQAFVFIDEFHRLAARNIVEMLEDARSAGVGFVLAHQSSSSLQTREADLYGILFENCSFKQCLTLEDPRVVELFRLISGRVPEHRAGHSDGTSQGESSTSGSSIGHSDTQSRASTTGSSWTTTKGESSGSTRAMNSSSSTSSAKSQTDSWKEEMVPGLTPEMIQQVNDLGLVSLMHVKGVGDKGLTPTRGVPTLVQGLHLFLEPDYQQMLAQLWPKRSHIDVDEYYRKSRPGVSAAAVASVAEAIAGTGKKRDAGPPQKFDKPRNEGEQRDLQNRIETVVMPLASQMIPEPLSVELFARMHGFKLEQVMTTGAEIGLELTVKESLIRARDAERLKQRISPSRPGPPGPGKDNGSQGDPLSS